VAKLRLPDVEKIMPLTGRGSQGRKRAGSRNRRNTPPDFVRVLSDRDPDGKVVAALRILSTDNYRRMRSWACHAKFVVRGTQPELP